MKTKIQKTIIATSIAALFMAPIAAFAKEKDKWEYHEDKWGQVKSYGDVPLSRDSAGEWGPWSEFVQPAAGGPSVGLLPQVGGERYRTLPAVNQNQPNPQASDVRGYAAYINDSYSYGEGYSYSNTGHHPGRIALSLFAPESGQGEGAASFQITGFPGELAPLQGDSGILPSNFDGPVGVFSANGSTGNRSAWIDGGEGHPDYYDASYVTHGDFYNYLSGDGGESSTYGSYVDGIVTPQTDIATLQAGNVQARYEGYTVYPHSGHNHFPESEVVINVNFGNATWDGTWNGGMDGSVHTHGADSAGIDHLYGQVGFTAQGTISGANIQSINVDTFDEGATVSGQVQGSFYGPQAAAVGGVSDITKTNPSAGYENARNVDLFIANKVVAE